MNYVTYAELFQLISMLASLGTFFVALIALVISIHQMDRNNKKKK